MKARLSEHYEAKVKPELIEEFKYGSSMEAPKMIKVMVSMCLKEATGDMKVLERGMEEVAATTGQQPKITRAKKSIAAFKLREGMPLGCVATLRGARMYEFLDRLTNVALPRVRDFRGLPRKGFDGRGNFTMGLKEQIIFPEIVYEKVDKARGMNITVVTTAKTDKEGFSLLEKMGFPFQKK